MTCEVQAGVITFCYILSVVRIVSTEHCINTEIQTSVSLYNVYNSLKKHFYGYLYNRSNERLLAVPVQK